MRHSNMRKLDSRIAAAGAVNGIGFAALQEGIGTALADRRAACFVVPLGIWLVLTLGAVAGVDRTPDDS